MANIQLIQQKLPQELWETASNFNIPDYFLEKEPDLVVLILNSRSLAQKDEKQSWFNLIPIMNSEQIEKLRDILTRERDKIAEIEAKYEQKKQEIKEKYQTRFDETAYNNKISMIKSSEAVQREKEAAEVENLFDDL
jgi:hypothetical protein